MTSSCILCDVGDGTPQLSPVHSDRSFYPMRIKRLYFLEYRPIRLLVPASLVIDLLLNHQRKMTCFGIPYAHYPFQWE